MFTTRRSFRRRWGAGDARSARAAAVLRSGPGEGPGPARWWSRHMSQRATRSARWSAGRNVHCIRNAWSSRWHRWLQDVSGRGWGVTGPCGLPRCRTVAWPGQASALRSGSNRRDGGWSRGTTAMTMMPRHRPRACPCWSGPGGPGHGPGLHRRRDRPRRTRRSAGRVRTRWRRARTGARRMEVAERPPRSR